MELLHLGFTPLLKSSQAAASEEEWKKTVALRQSERERTREFDKYRELEKKKRGAALFGEKRQLGYRIGGGYESRAVFPLPNATPFFSFLLACVSSRRAGASRASLAHFHGDRVGEDGSLMAP